MPKFTVRVELRNSQNADYEKLNEMMMSKGFLRTIPLSGGGAVLLLPDAEYNYESMTKFKSQVGRLAESVARQFCDNPKIMVTKSAGRWFANLDEA